MKKPIKVLVVDEIGLLLRFPAIGLACAGAEGKQGGACHPGSPR